MICLNGSAPKTAICVFVLGVTLQTQSVSAQVTSGAKPAPLTDLAQSLPQNIVRMTTWKYVNSAYTLIDARELQRSPVENAGQKTSPSKAVANAVQLSDRAISDARSLIATDTISNFLIVFEQRVAASNGRMARIRPPGAEVLTEGDGKSSYFVRRTMNDQRRLFTTVNEERGRLKSLLTVIETRDGNNWWKEGTVARIFDSSGAQSVVVSQYPKPLPRRAGG